MFSLYEYQTGCQLPPNCRESTRNDSLLAHPLLTKYVHDAEILQDKAFDSHTPMLVHFQLPDVIPQALKWSKPSKFAELHIPTDVVAAAFRCVPPLSRHEMLDTHLSEWSRHVEPAFNKAVVMHHQADPLRQMQKQLPIVVVVDVRRKPNSKECRRLVLLKLGTEGMNPVPRPFPRKPDKRCARSDAWRV